MSALFVIAAHLAGDFLLQNHWMQKKAVSSFVCTVHVACYALPWLMLVAFNVISLPAFCLIIAEHWIQDHYALHLKWMRFFSQTTVSQWPVGPLCIDQAFHISWIATVIAVLS